MSFCQVRSGSPVNMIRSPADDHAQLPTTPRAGPTISTSPLATSMTTSCECIPLSRPIWAAIF
jgi:hypothetical protein